MIFEKKSQQILNKYSFLTRNVKTLYLICRKQILKLDFKIINEMSSLPNIVYIHSEMIGDDNKMVTTPSFVDEIELPSYEQLCSPRHPLAYRMVVTFNMLYKMTRNRNQDPADKSDQSRLQNMERVRSRILVQLGEFDKYMKRNAEEKEHKGEDAYHYDQFHTFYNFISPHLQPGADYKADGDFVKLKRAVWEQSLKISKTLSPKTVILINEKMDLFLYAICAIAQWLQ